MRKTWVAFLTKHKIRGLLQVPSTLRFIENDHVLDWRTSINQGVIAEVVNILNERFDAFTDLTFPHFLSLFLSACDFVAGQCFPKDGN
jgi:hypothetical protein